MAKPFHSLLSKLVEVAIQENKKKESGKSYQNVFDASWLGYFGDLQFPGPPVFQNLARKLPAERPAEVALSLQVDVQIFAEIWKDGLRSKLCLRPREPSQRGGKIMNTLWWPLARMSNL